MKIEATAGHLATKTDETVKPLSVSEFVSKLNEVLVEQVAWVEGEVCNMNLSQGKWLHFSLKDNDSLMNCFAMAFRVKTPIEDGMKVRVWGVPKVYPKFGKLTLNVEIVEPSGEGALKRAFELLKQKLESEGLFRLDRKRRITRFPERVGLVTSPEAAAYSDFLKVLKGRRGGIEIFFVPVAVQGKDAPTEICAAIEQLNEQMPDLDALVLVRGGGSLEDLHAFNDESVVRALARSRIPTITGVGHERDVTLVDFVADVRASTPSNVAELVTPTRTEILGSIENLSERLCKTIENNIRGQEKNVGLSVSILHESIIGPIEKVQMLAQRMMNVGRIYSLAAEKKTSAVNNMITHLRAAVDNNIRAASRNLLSAERMVVSLHPQNTLKRGYSITRNSKGKVIKDAAELEDGEAIETVLGRGIINSIIDSQTCQKRLTSQKPTKSLKKSLEISKQATLI